MKYGEIMTLGRHRVMCGDSTKPEDVSRLMQDTRAKLLFTSPPYSDIYEYSGNDLTPAHLAEFIPAFRNNAEIMCVNLGLKKHNHEIITYWDEYIYSAHNAGLKLLSWNVWDKINPGSIAQQHFMFPLRHEFIFVFGEIPRTLNDTIPKKCATPDRTHRPVRQKDGSMKYTTAQYSARTHKPLESVIEQTPVKSRPVWGVAQMPVELAREYILAVTQEGDSVIDPFGGSGTTLIACEQTGRKCFTMEINPEMCEIIAKRFRAYQEEMPLWNTAK